MITADLHIAQVKTQSNPQSAPIVFVVDDDISIRESLELLLRHEGFEVETFESAQDFLDRPRTSVPSCLILDISLPGLNGLDLQRRIAVERHEMPIIFITGHGSIPMSVQAMKAGAVEFLTKPFTDNVLLNSILNAIERSKVLLDRDEILRNLKNRYKLLTAREREVFVLVVSGLPNKQIGSELGISEITVKAHRGSMMRKMQASSLADLVNMATRLRVMRLRPSTVQNNN
jgi:FixJ family two-component response regulator